MVAVIFKSISMLISYWLSPNLFEKFKKQMVESVSYKARIVQRSEVLLNKQQQDFME
jgi:ABC-type enterochelin transport system permease subunit